jgi:nucleoside-diphosphate-sugar epimerase
MRVLVLGGTRFIGAAAVRRLVSRGHEVIAFHRGKTHAELPPQVTHLQGDRARLDEHAAALRGARPDAVLDTLAMTEADGRALVRVLGSVARLVVLSSADVYRAHGRLWRHEPGPPDPVPLAEGAPLREKLFPYRHEPGQEMASLHDYDKILVERAVAQASATVLRLPAVYGPRDYRARVGEHLAPMMAGDEEIELEIAQAGWRWTRGHVDDVAAAITLAIEAQAAAARTYNVGEADALTEREWVEAIGRAAGWRGRVVTKRVAELPARWKAAAFDFAQDWTLDTRRIREELGFREERTREEAITGTVEWARAALSAAG